MTIVISLDRYQLVALRAKFLHSQKRYPAGSSKPLHSITAVYQVP